MEILEYIKLIVGATFIVCGLAIFFTELFGVFHFHYVLNRMHAAAMGDTLGISLCLIGLMIFSGLNFTTLKILLIIIFLWFTSPVSSHMLARLEVTTNEHLKDRCDIYDNLKTLEAELDNTKKSGGASARNEEAKPDGEARSDKTSESGNMAESDKTGGEAR